MTCCSSTKRTKRCKNRATLSESYSHNTAGETDRITQTLPLSVLSSSSFLMLWSKGFTRKRWIFPASGMCLLSRLGVKLWRALLNAVHSGENDRNRDSWLHPLLSNLSKIVFFHSALAAAVPLQNECLRDRFESVPWYLTSIILYLSYLTPVLNYILKMFTRLPRN